MGVEKAVAIKADFRAVDGLWRRRVSRVGKIAKRVCSLSVPFRSGATS